MNHQANGSTRRASAFTLIELLTVLAIIGILAAIIIPTVSAVRETARNATCKSRIRQWGMAFTLYANDNRGNYLVFGGGAPWCQEGANPPYVRYLNSGPAVGASQRLGDFLYCPSQVGAPEVPGNTPVRSNFVAIVPTVNGNTVNPAKIPLSRATTPAKTLMMIERQWNETSGAPETSGFSGSDLSFRKENSGVMSSHYVNFNRHKRSANALFMDGHVGPLAWEAMAEGGPRGSFDLKWIALDR